MPRVTCTAMLRLRLGTLLLAGMFVVYGAKELLHRSFSEGVQAFVIASVAFIAYLLLTKVARRNNT